MRGRRSTMMSVGERKSSHVRGSGRMSHEIIGTQHLTVPRSKFCAEQKKGSCCPLRKILQQRLPQYFNGLQVLSDSAFLSAHSRKRGIGSWIPRRRSERKSRADIVGAASLFSIYASTLFLCVREGHFLILRIKKCDGEWIRTSEFERFAKFFFRTKL